MYRKSSISSQVSLIKQIKKTMEVIIPIGISGSGKSRLYEKRYKDYEIISPDLIRKELTGDISNQKRNKEVFQIALKRVSPSTMMQPMSILNTAGSLSTSSRIRTSRSSIWFCRQTSRCHKEESLLI